MGRDRRAIDPDARIAVVGAGPAGLSTAWFLAKKGFRNVTVLEKLGRVGGLCESITIDGRSYDLGANYVTWAYRHTLGIAAEVGAETYLEKPYTTIYIHSDGGERAAYRPLIDAILFNPYTGKKIGLFSLAVAALRYLWIRWRLDSIINPPDALEKIDRHPELCVPFKDWLEARGLIDLASLFEIPITVMGYGQLTDIAAPYALRYMSVKTFFPILLPHIPLVGGLLQLLFPWPRRFTYGFQRLWEKVAWRVNVRLNATIFKIERRPGAPITVHFNYPEQQLNDIRAVEKRMEFDYLVLACPLTPDVLRQLGLERNEGERAVSEAIRFNDYCMTTFWVDRMKRPEPIAPVLPIPRRGGPWAVARQFQAEGNHFTQFYTRPRESQSDAGVIGEARRLVSLLGGEIDESRSRWHSFDRWTYFQHVTPEQIAGGFYARLARMQGEDRTFYAGGVTDFELVEPIVQHSKYLVEKHFSGRAG